MLHDELKEKLDKLDQDIQSNMRATLAGVVAIQKSGKRLLFDDDFWVTESNGIQTNLLGLEWDKETKAVEAFVKKGERYEWLNHLRMEEQIQIVRRLELGMYEIVKYRAG